MITIPWPVLLGAALAAVLMIIPAAMLVLRAALWVMRTADTLISDNDLAFCDHCEGSWFLDCECTDGGCGRPGCPVGRFNQAMFGWLDAQAEGSGEHG